MDFGRLLARVDRHLLRAAPDPENGAVCRNAADCRSESVLVDAAACLAVAKRAAVRDASSACAQQYDRNRSGVDDFCNCRDAGYAASCDPRFVNLERTVAQRTLHQSAGRALLPGRLD